MAIANPTESRPRSLVNDNQRVRSPLQRLRGYIRTYVTLEGAALTGVFLAIAFWISLIIDYGSFKAFSLDWVQLVKKWWGISFLIIVGLGFVAVVLVNVVRRLVKDFRDTSLAMVLENRFPNQLGDRLITAVELSDPARAEELGYSSAMVRETIHEAADRVDQVPVGEVFDWKRLVGKGLWVLVLTLVAGGIAVGGFTALTYGYYKQSGLSGWYSFSDVVAIWFDRNVKLKNTPWPRRAQLQILTPSDDPLRIGYDAPAPTVRVRALQYVIADEGTYEGWRSLTVKDVEALVDNVPKLPAEWKTTYETGSLTMDEVALNWNRFPVRRASLDEGFGAEWVIRDRNPKTPDWRPLLWSDLNEWALNKKVPELGPEWDIRAEPLKFAGLVGMGATPFTPVPALGTAPVATAFVTLDEVETKMGQVAFEKHPMRTDLDNLVFARLRRFDEVRKLIGDLDAVTDDPGMSRTVRKLIVPEKVTLYYTVKDVTNEVQMPLDTRTNEYSEDMKNLKVGEEEYRAQAEDFYTPWREVVILPPPAVEKLLVYQNQPAYLFYRPDPDAPELKLAGVKQPLAPLDVTSAGSDISRFTVPAGTDLTLSVRVNKPVNKVEIGEAKKAEPVKADKILKKDNVITLKFDNVRREMKFVLKFTDPDNVLGSRTIHVKVEDDKSPEMRAVAPHEIVRRAKDGSYKGMYMVTTKARIPFDGEIDDDHGLAAIRYAYTLRPVSATVKASKEVIAMLLTAPLLGHMQQNGLGAGLQYFAGFQQASIDAAKAVRKLEIKRSDNLPGFVQALTAKDKELLPASYIEELLGKRQKLPFRQLLNRYELKRDTLKRDSFDRVIPSPVVNDFPVAPLGLTVKGKGAIQPHYLMQLWVEATDTDLDTRKDDDGNPMPHVSPSRDRFFFVLVGENELLTEIGRDEEDLRIKLEEMFSDPKNAWTHKPLIQLEADLIKEHIELAAGDLKPRFLPAMADRVGKSAEILGKAELWTSDIVVDYQKLIDEMEFNAVSPEFITKVNLGIVKPLREAVDDLFPEVIQEMGSFRSDLVAGSTKSGAEFTRAVTQAKGSGQRARDKMKALKAKLEQVLAAMQKLTDINRLIKMLRNIDETEREQFEMINRIKLELEKKILEDLGLPPGEKP